MTRIKEDIIRELMNQINQDRAESKFLVDTLLERMKENFREGNRVMISGFGTFKVRYKKKRIGRNPKTKETYLISERNVVSFVASRKFREEIAQ